MLSIFVVDNFNFRYVFPVSITVNETRCLCEIVCFFVVEHFRYLKSIYPKAEETFLLDILANADNNVQKASEKLNSMGYEKRDTTAPKQTNRNKEEQVMKERYEAENTPPPLPKFKSTEDKQKSIIFLRHPQFTFERQHFVINLFISVKNQLQARYKDVAGRIITMALESVDYSEDKACKILEIVMQDDKNTKVESKQEIVEDACVENEAAADKPAPSQPPKTDAR